MNLIKIIIDKLRRKPLLVKPRQPHLPQTNISGSVCDHEFAVHPRFGDLYCTKCYMPKGFIKQTDV